jgi:hypothetical protein
MESEGRHWKPKNRFFSVSSVSVKDIKEITLVLEVLEKNSLDI